MDVQGSRRTIGCQITICPRRETSPPRHLPQTQLTDNPKCRLRRHIKRIGDGTGMHERPYHDQFDQRRLPRRSRRRQRGFGPGKQGGDRRKLCGQRIGSDILLPHPIELGTLPVREWRRCDTYFNRRIATLGTGPAQAVQASRALRPTGLLRRNTPARPHHAAGNGELMGRGANIVAGVMQHEVFEVDQLAIDPERGASVGKTHALKPARPHRRSCDPRVEPRQRDTCVGHRPEE